MVLGKKVAIFDWEWGQNSAPRQEQKMPCLVSALDKREIFEFFCLPVTLVKIKKF